MFRFACDVPWDRFGEAEAGLSVDRLHARFRIPLSGRDTLRSHRVNSAQILARQRHLQGSGWEFQSGALIYDATLNAAPQRPLRAAPLLPRCIPDLVVLRPADANETAEVWRVALKHRTGPVASVLTRQKLSLVDRATHGAAS